MRARADQDEVNVDVDVDQLDSGEVDPTASFAQQKSTSDFDPEAGIIIPPSDLSAVLPEAVSNLLKADSFALPNRKRAKCGGVDITLFDCLTAKGEIKPVLSKPHVESVQNRRRELYPCLSCEAGTRSSMRMRRLHAGSR